MNRIIILFLGVLFSCTNSSEKNNKYPHLIEHINNYSFEDEPYLGEPTSVDTSKITILLPENEYDWRRLSENKADLNSSDLLNIEIILSHIVDDKRLYESDWELKNNIKAFNRWYVPYTINGHKIIKVYSYAGTNDKLMELWRESTPLIEDGGKSYFEVTINLSTKEYFDFEQGAVG